MPRRIVEIELGLCFLIMFGTATIADDEVVFDLSEASIEQVSAQQRPVGKRRSAQTAPYSLSPQPASTWQQHHSTVIPHSEYPQPGNAEFGSPASAYPPSGNQPYRQPQTAYPQSGYPAEGYPQSGYPQPGYPPSGYPQTGSPEPAYPQAGSAYPQQGYPQSEYPQSGYSGFAPPGGEYPHAAYPEFYNPAFAPGPDAGQGLFDWRPQPPHFERPSRTYSLFRSNASYGWRYTERCAPTPWKPRGDGIPRRTSCYRMDYAPYELEHDSSRHGPAFYRRHELYPCVECHQHAHHLQRFYGPRH
jgi:hypothetical protein